MPPEFSATIPPTVHHGALEGSGGKKNPSFRSSEFRSSRTTPASQWTNQLVVSIFKIRFMRFEKSRTKPPKVLVAPVRLVPAPLATTGILCSFAYLRRVDTWSGELGCIIASGCE